MRIICKCCQQERREHKEGSYLCVRCYVSLQKKYKRVTTYNPRYELVSNTHQTYNYSMWETTNDT